MSRFDLSRVPMEAVVTVAAIVGVAAVLVVRWFVGYL